MNEPMPQRFLRPGLMDSERWNGVDFDAQSLYVRLLMTVDDYGRCDGRNSVVGKCFSVWNALHPERQVSLMRVAELLEALSEVKLIERYSVGDKVVIQLTQWVERIREGAKEKFPTNPNSCDPLRPAADSCDPLPPTPSPTSTPSPSGQRQRKPFVKPTVEELRLACAKTGLPEIEAEKFYNYYESKGWFVGKSPMKSWVGALANWKINWQQSNGFGGRTNGKSGRRYVPNI